MAQQEHNGDSNVFSRKNKTDKNISGKTLKFNKQQTAIDIIQKISPDYYLIIDIHEKYISICVGTPREKSQDKSFDILHP